MIVNLVMYKLYVPFQGSSLSTGRAARATFFTNIILDLVMNPFNVPLNMLTII